MKSISFILTVAFILGCSTDNSSINGNSEISYVQGEVSFGLKDSVTLIDLANYIYSLDSISIKEVVSFRYYTFLSWDSMQTIKSTLESKAYIWSGMVNTSYIESDSKILIKFWIKDFKSENREDWLSLKGRFSLIHSPSNYQLGLLKVEIGKEKEWLNLLLNTNLFQFVELNFIDHTC